MYRGVSAVRSGLRLCVSSANFVNSGYFIRSDFQILSSRGYCTGYNPPSGDQRYPRRLYRNPVSVHRRIELPNPDFTDRKPKPLESLDYFDEHPSKEELPEPDLLYSSIEIETRSHDEAVLKSYEKFALSAAGHLGITVSSVFLPRERYIWWMRTLLRSVHIFKKRRFQYETRTHYRRFTIARVTGSTADTFLEYIQRNLPEGVGMRVMRRLLVERPDYLKQPPIGVVLQQAEEKESPLEKQGSN